MVAARSYEERRGWLQNYFDRTAADTWAKLTSDGKVSRIRATVRAGRQRTAENLLAYLPESLVGARVLDAGCGTGTLSVELARRGAHVVAIDLSSTLVELAADRARQQIGDASSHIDFRSGDMLDPELGRFDHVVAMDSLIHYDHDDLLEMVAALAARCDGCFAFTIAPRTALLSMMHAAGKLFPRGDRSPRIVPTSVANLRRAIGERASLGRFEWAATERVDSGFYISQSVLLRAEASVRS